VFPGVPKGGEEWNIVNGYFRGVSVHRHRFAALDRAGAVLSGSLLGKNDLLICLAFLKKKKKKNLYLLPLPSASFKWLLKKFPAFSPTQLAKVEYSCHFNSRMLEMREQARCGLVPEPSEVFSHWLYWTLDHDFSFSPPFFLPFFSLSSPEKLSTHLLMLFILSVKKKSIHQNK